MEYYLENQELFPEGIRRIGLALNNAAIDALAADDEATHEGIHQARRCFKRLRSLFQLIRDAIGKPAFREGDGFYRGLARQLERLRDISSLIEAVELLRSHFGEVVRVEAFDSLGALLEAEKANIHSSMAVQSSEVDDVIQALQGGRERLLALPVPEGSLEAVVQSLFRQYKGGYRLFGKASGKPSVAEMHDWRKRVKHLWHMHEILHNAWPKVFKAYVKSYKELGDTLGNYHDLALLQDKLDSYETLLPEDSRRLLRVISQEAMETLLVQSRRLGKRLFSEKPDAFARRMYNILRSWEIKGFA